MERLKASRLSRLSRVSHLRPPGRLKRMSVSEPVSASSFVTLRGGLIVNTAAIVLLLDLEARGVKLERERDDILVHAPAANLTAEDRTLLRRYKPHVLALLDYVERVQ